MHNKIEEIFINKYVVKEKRKRYLEFISKEKTRSKFTQELYHFKDLDWKLFREIPGSQNERTEILSKVIQNKNIQNCHVISANLDIDGTNIPYPDAIVSCVGEEGTILIFGNADVVYYEAEPFDGRFISI